MNLTLEALNEKIAHCLETGEKLDLSTCFIIDEDIPIILEAIKKRPRPHYVDLSYNLFGNQGAKLLAASHLQGLDLSHNRIEDEGGYHFIHNLYLLKINLDNTFILPKIKKLINERLALNIQKKKDDLRELGLTLDQSADEAFPADLTEDQMLNPYFPFSQAENFNQLKLKIKKDESMHFAMLGGLFAFTVGLSWFFYKKESLFLALGSGLSAALAFVKMVYHYYQPQDIENLAYQKVKEDFETKGTTLPDNHDLFQNLNQQNVLERKKLLLTAFNALRDKPENKAAVALVDNRANQTLGVSNVGEVPLQFQNASHVFLDSPRNPSELALESSVKQRKTLKKA